MKIYILKTEYGSDVCIYGIYSTKGKAVESLPYHDYPMSEADIEEAELDPPHGSERFENFCFAAVCQNGARWYGEDNWKRPSDPDLQKHHFNNWDGRFGVLAYGRTKDEAEQKAAAALPLLHPVWQVARHHGGQGNYKTGFIEIHQPHPSKILRWENIPGLEDKVYAVHEDLNVARIALLEYEKTGSITPFLSHPSNRQPPQT